MQETHVCNIKDVEKWNSEWGGRGFWSFGSYDSRGVGILIHTSLDVSNVIFKHDFEGRVILADVDLNNSCKMRLICIYAPNEGVERKEFIESLQYYLNTPRKVVLGGDFNFVENLSLDKQGGLDFRGNKGAIEMASIKKDFSLKDAFRNLFPSTKKLHTFKEISVLDLTDFMYHPT